jgi:hypothetical protein
LHSAAVHPLIEHFPTGGMPIFIDPSLAKKYVTTAIQSGEGD